MPCPFKIGEVVERNGTDRQIVLGIDEFFEMIEVECIHPDDNGTYRVGDREWNGWCRYVKVPHEGN